MRKNKICSLSTKQTFYRKNKDNNDDRVNKPYPRKRKKKFCNDIGEKLETIQLSLNRNGSINCNRNLLQNTL